MGRDQQNDDFVLQLLEILLVGVELLLELLRLVPVYLLALQRVVDVPAATMLVAVVLCPLHAGVPGLEHQPSVSHSSSKLQLRDLQHLLDRSNSLLPKTKLAFHIECYGQFFQRRKMTLIQNASEAH